MGNSVESIARSTIMKVAIFFCFLFSVALAYPGETGPGCYHCDNASEKCCNVDGNHFCAPTWQNCYGFQFEDFDKSKASEPTEKEVVSGVVDLKKQCARYTGSGVHSAQDCSRVCFQGGYNTY